MAWPSKFILLALGLAFLFQYAGAQPGSNMSLAINSTLGYVNMVNQSAYLVFYPNLTASYNYMSNATNVSRTDPAYAYALLAKARSSAGQQLSHINQYRTGSFYLLIAFSAALAALLYALMRPKAAEYREKNRNSRSDI